MTTTSKHYRVAVIGCGDIARTGHIPALLDHPRFNLTTLCDRQTAILDPLAQHFNIPNTTTDYRTLLTCDDIDAVILALHPQHSVAIAIDAIHAGKPVLDEKPIAVSLNAANHLRDEIEKHHAVYQLGFVLRNCDWVQGIANYAQQLGTPTLTQVSVYDEPLNPNDPSHTAKIQSILQHSSAITHEGSHVVDYVKLWQPDAMENMHADAMCTDTSLPGPNIWHATMNSADGSVLTITIGWLLAELPSSGIRVVGPKGWIDVDMFTGIGMGIIAGQTQKISLPPLSQAWDRQLDHFAHAIDTGHVTGPTVDDGISALTMTAGWEAFALSNTA